MATVLAGVRTSKVSPAFLHGNSTSHTWPFSAIAELIDNAYDPDVNASELWIDKRVVNKTVCLTFVDNGNGMNQDKLHKMLSFGYCEKVQVGQHKPIGYYGNGFKSGSMRLGMDAIVFTRQRGSMSVGMLSQSYLKAVNADEVLVPIVTWNLPSKTRGSNPVQIQNLKAILRYSVFHKEEELLNELDALGRVNTGTNIIIYNLKRDRNGKFELDFESDPYDIRNPETHIIDLSTINRPVHQSSPQYKVSLRHYCSLLYLKPRMKIIIRGKKVKSKLVSKSLSQTENDVYRPTWLDKPLKITFGFTSSKEPEEYGMLMYHKNRLIKAYEKVGYQKQKRPGIRRQQSICDCVACEQRLGLKANELGVGVVGVVEGNFLEPIHNKQDFNRTEKYNAFLNSLGNKLNDYWNEKMGGGRRMDTSVQQLPDWTWAQCDNCLKWRRLPGGITSESLPEKWYCYLNPDAAFNRCDIREEPEDEDEALQQATYKKTFKKQQAEKNRQMKEIEARRIQIREQELMRKEQFLDRRQQEIEQSTEELAEVSSTQDINRKPTIADLKQARRALDVAKVKLQEQQNVIQQLEKQKKNINIQGKKMIQMADGLRLSNIKSMELVDKVEGMAGTSRANKVTSSSGSGKRQHANTSDGAGGKRMIIKTEDGESITVVPNEEEDPNANIIDLTMSDEETDVKPNVRELDQRVRVKTEPADSSQEKLNEKSSKNLTTEQKLEQKSDSGDNVPKQVEKKISVVSKSSQTVPVVIRFASPQEVELEKLSPLEKKQALVQKSRDLEETKKELGENKEKLNNLQKNISHLLKIIVPDFDYGEPENIENIILDFIRVNAEQS